MTKSRGIRHAKSYIRIVGETAYVELSRGLEAIIDVDDINLVENRKWYAVDRSDGTTAYAFASNPGKRAISMHRLLMKPADKVSVDHRNGIGLDNRRSNLRIVTHAENMQNKKLDKRNKFLLRGVTEKSDGFSACIQNKGISIYLGRFITKEEAAAAYRGAHKALWGEFPRD